MAGTCSVALRKPRDKAMRRPGSILRIPAASQTSQHVLDNSETTSAHLEVLVAWQSELCSRKILLEGTMSHCVCGHPEEAHLFGGRCRVPGCMCDRFWPIPEISAQM